MNRSSTRLLAAALIIAGAAISLFCLQTVPSAEPAAGLQKEPRSSDPNVGVGTAPHPARETQYSDDDPKQLAFRAEMQRQHDLLAAENAGTLNEKLAAQAFALEEQPEFLTPLILRKPNPSVVLDAAEARTLEAVRHSFNAAMAKAGDPSSPEYLERWLVEQERADELLTAYLGVETIGKFGIPFDPARTGR